MNTACGERVGEDFETKGSEQILTRPPLVVDLDGTLVKTNLLIESVLALLREQPLCLFMLPVWIARGKACFKHEVARRAALEVATLPWRGEVIDYLRRQRGEGRSLVLATGADIRIARQVADHLKLFDTVLASNGTVNLCGEAKRDRLVSQFGERGFDYAADGGGGARSDLAVWRSARKAILINPKPHVRKAAARVTGIDQIFADAKTGLVQRLKALRPSHWLKNLLVLVPLFAAHRFQDIVLLETSLLAFVAFGCCASSGYLFNDLIDLDADLYHALRRRRASSAPPRLVSQFDSKKRRACLCLSD